MKSHNSPRRRRGYAMISVLIFLAIMLSVVSVSQRYVASTVRAEWARVQAVSRDEGRLSALAMALELLETGLPPTDPYICAATLDTSRERQSFSVSFSSDGGTRWTVQVAPLTQDADLEPMPSSFAN